MTFLKGNIAWNKGKKGLQVSWSKGLTKDNNTSLKRISDKLMGRRLSKEHIKVMSNSLRGKKAWNKGKHTGNYGNGFKKDHIPWNKGIKGKASHSYGHTNFEKDPEKRKEYARLGSLALFRKKGPTSIEFKLYQFLKENNILFEKQELINGRFLVDAYIPDKNLILEVDGKYWHSLDRVVKKDKAENAYLVKCGYNLLRLTESEIMNSMYKRRILKCL